MSKTILIGIIPPDEIKEKIEKIRSEIKEKKYHFNYPHITLYINSFEDISLVENQLLNISFEPFEIEYIGITFFKNDPLLNIFNLIYKIRKGKKQLDKIKLQIIEKIHKYKTKDYENFLLSLNQNLSKKQKENIQKTGDVIDFENYIYHTTCCSINNYETVKKIIKNSKFKLNYVQKVYKLALFVFENEKLVFKKYL